MKSNEAIEQMLLASGQRPTHISAAVGHAPNFVAVIISRKRDVRASTLATIADACGYSLQLVPNSGGGSLVIDGGGPADTGAG